jgi:putative ABC transport system permease protein
LLLKSFRHAPRRKLLALLALMLGAGTATGLAAVAVSAGDAMGREFRAVGANFRLVPEEAALPLAVAGGGDRAATMSEHAVAALAGPQFFWRRNVTALTPLYPLDARVDGTPTRVNGAWFEHRLRASDGEELTTGLPQVYPAWELTGRWPRDGENAVVLGAQLARRRGARPGSDVRLRAGTGDERVTVCGIVAAGGTEDGEAFAPIQLVQRLAGDPGRAREALVSGITTPESRLMVNTGLDPSRLSPADYDRWYCTNYPSSIVRRIEESVPGVKAMTIRRAAETEGRVLTRLNGLMLVAAAAALVTAALGLLSTVLITLLERRREIGLLTALGADEGTIATIFLGEALVLALVGGLGGWLLGQGVGSGLSQVVFGRGLTVSMATLPLALAASLVTVALATWPPVRAALRWDPVAALRG